MTVLFFFLSIILCSLSLWLCQNTIQGILILLAIFLATFFILISLNFEFIALLFLLIYVGGIIVVFLFSIFLLNLKIKENNTDPKYFNYITLTTIIIITGLIYNERLLLDTAPIFIDLTNILDVKKILYTFEPLLNSIDPSIDSIIVIISHALSVIPTQIFTLYDKLTSFSFHADALEKDISIVSKFTNTNDLRFVFLYKFTEIDYKLLDNFIAYLGSKPGSLEGKILKAFLNENFTDLNFILKNPRLNISSYEGIVENIMFEIYKQRLSELNVSSIHTLVPTTILEKDNFNIKYPFTKFDYYIADKFMDFLATKPGSVEGQSLYSELKPHFVDFDSFYTDPTIDISSIESINDAVLREIHKKRLNLNSFNDGSILVFPYKFTKYDISLVDDFLEYLCTKPGSLEGALIKKSLRLKFNNLDYILYNIGQKFTCFEDIYNYILFEIYKGHLSSMDTAIHTRKCFMDFPYKFTEVDYSIITKFYEYLATKPGSVEGQSLYSELKPHFVDFDSFYTDPTIDISSIESINDAVLREILKKRLEDFNISNNNPFFYASKKLNGLKIDPTKLQDSSLKYSYKFTESDFSQVEKFLEFLSTKPGSSKFQELECILKSRFHDLNLILNDPTIKPSNLEQFYDYILFEIYKENLKNLYSTTYSSILFSLKESVFETSKEQLLQTLPTDNLHANHLKFFNLIKEDLSRPCGHKPSVYLKNVLQNYQGFLRNPDIFNYRMYNSRQSFCNQQLVYYFTACVPTPFTGDYFESCDFALKQNTENLFSKNIEQFINYEIWFNFFCLPQISKQFDILENYILDIEDYFLIKLLIKDAYKNFNIGTLDKQHEMTLQLLLSDFRGDPIFDDNIKRTLNSFSNYHEILTNPLVIEYRKTHKISQELIDFLNFEILWNFEILDKVKQIMSDVLVVLKKEHHNIPALREFFKEPGMTGTEASDKLLTRYNDFLKQILSGQEVSKIIFDKTNSWIEINNQILPFFKTDTLPHSLTQTVTKPLDSANNLSVAEICIEEPVKQKFNLKKSFVNTDLLATSELVSLARVLYTEGATSSILMSLLLLVGLIGGVCLIHYMYGGKVNAAKKQ